MAVAKVDVRLILRGMVEARGCGWVRLLGDRCLDPIFDWYRLGLTALDPLPAEVMDETDLLLGLVRSVGLVGLVGSMNNPNMDIIFFNGLIPRDWPKW